MAGSQPVTRWRIDLEYDGSEFAGWQVQPNAPTIQAAVESVLNAFVGHPVRVQAAGRTDAGVHAKQQVAVFDTHEHRTPSSVLGALNGGLPQTVSCTAAMVVPLEFDPRHTPHVKTYAYRWLCGRSRSPLRRARTWWVPHDLDVVAMHRAAKFLVGTHDFTSFRAQGCCAKHAIRTVQGASVRNSAGHEIVLTVEGTGFLRHMVRIAAGTLLEIGRGARNVEAIGETLRARDRTKAGKTAPPQGLCLEAIDYTDD